MCYRDELRLKVASFKHLKEWRKVEKSKNQRKRWPRRRFLILSLNSRVPCTDGDVIRRNEFRSSSEEMKIKIETDWLNSLFYFFFWQICCWFSDWNGKKCVADRRTNCTNGENKTESDGKALFGPIHISPILHLGHSHWYRRRNWGNFYRSTQIWWRTRVAIGLQDECVLNVSSHSHSVVSTHTHILGRTCKGYVHRSIVACVCEYENTNRDEASMKVAFLSFCHRDVNENV